MTKAFLASALTTVVAFSSLLSARQAAPPDTAAPGSITIRGCVTESMGHYMLTQALLIKPVATPVPSAATEPAVKPPSDDQMYALLGAEVKAHVGHRVEVVGTMPTSAASGNAPASADTTRTAHPMAGTVTVTSIKMLAASCPVD